MSSPTLAAMRPKVLKLGSFPCIKRDLEVGDILVPYGDLMCDLLIYTLLVGGFNPSKNH